MTTLCIAGKNQIAVDVLSFALETNRWRVVALPNASDNGTDAWQPSFRRVASAAGVRLVRLEEIVDEPDLCFLSVEYDRLIKPDRFASNRLFNIHFSLLPQYRGCHTSIWPILNGEREHGVTLHWIDTGMDTGPVVAQRRFDLTLLNAREAYFRCMAEGTDLVAEWLEALVIGSPPVQPQDNKLTSTYSRSALDFSRKALNPEGTVEQLHRTFRAFSFPEFQLPTLDGREVKELQVEKQASGGSPPGTLQALGGGWHRLWAANGSVLLRFLRDL